jgi:hypothetical protein
MPADHYFDCRDYRHDPNLCRAREGELIGEEQTVTELRRI